MARDDREAASFCRSVIENALPQGVHQARIQTQSNLLFGFSEGGRLVGVTVPPHLTGLADAAPFVWYAAAPAQAP